MTALMMNISTGELDAVVYSLGSVVAGSDKAYFNGAQTMIKAATKYAACSRTYVTVDPLLAHLVAVYKSYVMVHGVTPSKEREGMMDTLISIATATGGEKKCRDEIGTIHLREHLKERARKA